MCVLEREREHIGSIWSRVTCLDSPLTAVQSLRLEGLDDSPLTAVQSLRLEGLDDFRSSQRLNNNDRKQAIQRIIKTVRKY
jgi:hypothetical protein